MFGLALGEDARAQAPLNVYAAASLGDALADAARLWTRQTRVDVRTSLAGSSALARQIEQGAPADIVILANIAWMDRLEAGGMLAPGSRRDLLGNDLVLIAPAPASPLDLDAPGALAAALGTGRLAIALTEAVPAGIYGRQALQSLGHWPEVRDRLAEADNVRAALALVARGEAPLGVVYATDAAAEDNVTLIARFPAASHEPITYPVARLAASDHPAAAAFLDWLATPEADAVFAAHGFKPLP